ncbi:hypothetical protein D9758_003923 [Tetrapyrgos nigripes]|uniref:F-box domain-containing protein n=1 Tax=Tetrapyrgos nigripes TaxID=182062 RepID=A0A8H5GLD4_9AGAR|nr:hypothetical protein D9758_003923 [Tetrapyrgos nigripes]
MTTMFSHSNRDARETISFILPPKLQFSAPPNDILHQIRFGNFMLVDAQKHQWTQTMDELEKRIEEQRNIVTQVLEVLAPLETEIGQLQDHWKTFHSLCWSPICKLPQELVVEVFKHTLSCHSLAIQADSVDAISRPVLDLSQICSYWRNILLTTPTLWTSIHIDIGLAALDINSYNHSTSLTLLGEIPRSTTVPVFDGFWPG